MPEIAIDGAKLFYDVSGSGEPILLIPGLGLDHAYYRLGAPLLARRMQVIAVDPRGIGRRPNRRRPTQSKAGPTTSRR